MAACTTDEVAPGDVLRFDVGPKTYCVYHAEDDRQFYATAGKCTHGAADLGDGAAAPLCLSICLHVCRFWLAVCPSVLLSILLHPAPSLVHRSGREVGAVIPLARPEPDPAAASPHRARDRQPDRVPEAQRLLRLQDGLTQAPTREAAARHLPGEAGRADGERNGGWIMASRVDPTARHSPPFLAGAGEGERGEAPADRLHGLGAPGPATRTGLGWPYGAPPVTPHRACRRAVRIE